MTTCQYCNSQNTKKITNYKYHDIIECLDCNRWCIQKLACCCRDPFEASVFKYNGGIPVAIHIQCYNCGGSLTMKKPLNFKQNSKDVSDEFSQERYDIWKKEKEIEANYIYKIAKHLRFLKSTYYEYIRYLQSEQWKSLRLLVLDRDGWICQYCKKERATEVHHLTYRNLGKENLNDLISYCTACHLLITKNSQI